MIRSRELKNMKHQMRRSEYRRHVGTRDWRRDLNFSATLSGCGKLQLCHRTGLQAKGSHRMATTLGSSTDDFVATCKAVAADLLRLPARHVWVDYDREADVLYMSFRKPQNATKTIEVDDDILIRKNGRTMSG